jgi:hypothetical protein
MLKEINHRSGTQQPGFETISAHRMSDHSMKRTYFPGIADIVVVTDPAEIRTISNDSRFDRDFIGHGPVLNVQRLRKMLRIFSLNGRRFPPMLPRTDPSRAAAQDELWSRLNVKADEVKHGPAELEPLAEWVRGIGTAEKLDLLVQQSIGRLFVETFTATEESLAAARMVHEAASSSNVLKMLGWRISGRLERAKTLLASMVNGDLAGVVAMINGRQLIVDGLQKCGNLLPTQRFDLQQRRMLPWTNASFHHSPLYARRKPPARSAVVPLEKARSSSLGCAARAKAQRIVTSSSSIRVGAAVPPKSGCLRYWKACGRVSQLRCMSLKKTSRPSLINS